MTTTATPASLIADAELHSLGTILDLTGKTVLITGAGSGIGRTLALGLARMGMNVAAVGRRTELLTELEIEADAAGLSIIGVVADVTDGSQIDAAVATTVERFGALHCAVANAGIAAVEPAIDMAEDAFRSVMDTNVVGVFNTARAAARAMSDGGSMVLTSSSFAKRGFDLWAPYNASKAAVSMLTETLASEWAGSGIRVNAIAPTATLTDVNAELFDDPEFAAGVIAGIPAGRILAPAELLLPTAFLLSSRNAMLLGHTLYVDGGQSL
ncbi:SDR family oxidoreductase [Rhodococcus sp. IEGM 1366]|uniref:SDR family NAD(P)-dependent oxidoreductase n=1 Tax=Rhodococcus sp. IEGM 1366 TaxID=3082223 RepID=UPI0029539544|nr:SDR family oxidoreductase [Rhodococcus sp. IEGM 1366]MDV8071304.1 SDR family oxidoreductase [Rhodococcus sp. IEGM 1366]